jgi:hypothetical protein
VSRQQQQRRTQPFTAATQQITRDFANRFAGVARLLFKNGLDLHQFVSNEVENLFYCQQ